jgi:hypothetical protein
MNGNWDTPRGYKILSATVQKTVDTSLRMDYNVSIVQRTTRQEERDMDTTQIQAVIDELKWKAAILYEAAGNHFVMGRNDEGDKFCYRAEGYEQAARMVREQLLTE